MDREAIRLEVRRLILDTDTTNPRWSDTVINDRIDISHDRISTLSECINDRITDGIDNAVSEYDLPDYFLNITSVAIKESGSSQWKGIKKVSEHELELLSDSWMNDTGTPRAYYMRGHKIGLYPIPNYTQTSSLRLDITRRPDAFTADTDIPFNSIPSLYAYHDILAFDVARMCSMDEGNANKIAIFSSEVDRILRQINYLLAADEEMTRMPNVYEQNRVGPRRVR
jgi:hypothetical protein